jgi:RNA polymerase sigma-70 factor (ECF subfamily)
MTASPFELDPTRLLAEARWMQRLAARLLHDADAAEDVAQDALVAAWRGARVDETSSQRRGLGGPEAEPRTRRAWLARVVVTRAWRAARAARAREGRERRVARPERVESTASIVARAEQHERVVAAVLALDEPYRTAVLLHYYDGLSAPEIAARTGVSPAAVRKRLSRGIAALRARLVERRELDMRALLLLAGHSSGTSSLGPVSLALPMLMKSKLSLVAAAVVVTLLALRVPWSADETAAQPDAIVASPETGRPAAPPRATPETPSAPRSALGTEVLDVGARQLHVVAEDGAPRAGARIFAALARERSTVAAATEPRLAELSQGQWRRWLSLLAQEALPPTYSDPERTLPEPGTELGVADSQGRWSIVADAARSVDQVGWIVQHPAATPLFIPDPWLTDRLATEGPALRVVAPTAATLEVSLENGNDGAPVTGSYVRVEQRFSSPDAEHTPHALVDPLAWFGPTDEHGAALVPGVPCGGTLWVSALGEHGSRPVEFRLDPHRSPARVKVLVWRYGSVRGRIVDGSGAACAGAVVLHEPPWAIVQQENGGARADPHGAFELVDVVAGRGVLGIHPLPQVDFVGHERVIEVPAGGVLDLGTLTVPHPEWIEGRLIGADTAGTQNYVTLVHGERATAGRGGVHADGTFRIAAHHGRNLLLVMRIDRWSDTPIVSVAVDVPSPTLEIDLTSQLGSLRATLPSGFPDGVTVTARLTSAPTEIAPQLPAYTEYTTTTTATTTEGGAFTLRGLSPGEYRLEASLDDLADAGREHVRIEPGVCTELGQLSLDPSRLDGRVVDGTGEPVADARIRCAAPPLDMWTGTGVERETRSRADGAFGLSQLAPRAWSVWAECADGRRSATVRVATTSGTTTALELVVDAPAWVDGVVLRGSRRAPADERVTWHYTSIRELKLDSDGPSAPVIPDEAGHFELGPFAPGDYVVVLRGEVTLATTVRLVGGQRERVTFDTSSPEAVFRTTCGGKPFEDIDSISAFALDPNGSGAGPQAFARRVGRSEFALTARHTRWLLAFQGRVQGARGTLFAVVEGDSLHGSTVAVPTASLIVDADPAGTRPPPRTYLVGLGEWALDPQFVHANQLVSEVREDGLVFHGIPDGARVRLVGHDERGVEHTRELVIRGGAAVRVAFP